MKKMIPLFFVCLFINSLFGTSAFAAQAQNSVIGVVGSFDQKFAKIKVSGKNYRLSRMLVIREKNRRGEIEPAVAIGANVELVFVGSSPTSGVKEIILLDGGSR